MCAAARLQPRTPALTCRCFVLPALPDRGLAMARLSRCEYADCAVENLAAF